LNQGAAPTVEKSVEASTFRDWEIEAYRAMVAQEAVEDTVRKLAVEPPMPMIRKRAAPGWAGVMDSAEVIQVLLTEPRVAKLVRIARSEDERARAALLKLVLEEMRALLEHADAPLALRTDLSQALPLICAYADHSGESLPVLVAYFDACQEDLAERHPGDEQLASIQHLLPENVRTDGYTWSPETGVAAYATRQILYRYATDPVQLANLPADSIDLLDRFMQYQNHVAAAVQDSIDLAQAAMDANVPVEEALLPGLFPEPPGFAEAALGSHTARTALPEDLAGWMHPDVIAIGIARDIMATGFE
jgi:hypothetical protein